MNPIIQSPTSVPIIIGSLLVFSIVLIFYGYLAHRLSKKAKLSTQPFTIVDALVASLLGLWLLSVIYASFGKNEEITLPMILVNSLLYFCLVSGIIGLLVLRHLEPVRLFGLKPDHPGRIIKTALLWLLVSYPLIMTSQAVAQLFYGAADDTQPIVTYFLQHPGWRERASIISMAVIVAPIAEELLFRGYFYGVLRRYAGRIPAIAISSILFAAMHLYLPSMLGLALLAIILCLVYERTGSLWANILVHATFNAISILMLLVFQTAAI
ncbi:MAG: lysostaphin resistance A-like protein [Chthoniobacterales bacterium]